MFSLWILWIDGKLEAKINPSIRLSSGCQKAGKLKWSQSWSIYHHFLHYFNFALAKKESLKKMRGPLWWYFDTVHRWKSFADDYKCFNSIKWWGHRLAAKPRSPALLIEWNLGRRSFAFMPRILPSAIRLGKFASTTPPFSHQFLCKENGWTEVLKTIVKNQPSITLSVKN